MLSCPLLLALSWRVHTVVACLLLYGVLRTLLYSDSAAAGCLHMFSISMTDGQPTSLQFACPLSCLLSASNLSPQCSICAYSRVKPRLD